MPTYTPPPPGERAYYRLSWVGGPSDEPATFWYEVDSHGAVLRTMAFYRDGPVSADALDRYPDGITEVAIGSLVEGDFFDSRLIWPWPAEDDAEATVLLKAEALEFTLLWKGIAA